LPFKSRKGATKNCRREDEEEGVGVQVGERRGSVITGCVATAAAAAAAVVVMMIPTHLVPEGCPISLIVENAHTGIPPLR